MSNGDVLRWLVCVRLGPCIALCSNCFVDSFGVAMGKFTTVKTRNPDGSVSMGYLFDGDPCVHAVIDCVQARDAAKYQLVYKELEFCEAAINYYLNTFPLVDGDVMNVSLDDDRMLCLRAIYMAAVVAYAKCFNNPGKNRTRLDRHKVFHNDQANFMAFHQWIMEEHRHNYISHSNETDLEEAFTVILFAPMNMAPGWYQISPHVRFSSVPDPRDMSSFLHVVKHVMDWVRAKIVGYLNSIPLSERDLAGYRAGAVYARKIKLAANAPAIFLPEA